MVNAVVLAGGKEKTNFIDIAKWVLFQIPYFITYQKIKLPGSCKSFMKVGGEIEGMYKRRPAIEYLLYSLDKSNLIEKVAIVTNTKKMQEKLDVNIKNYMGKCSIIPQVGSIKENAFHGYNSLKEKGHTLFIAGDSPQTTVQNLNEFKSKYEPYMDEFDILCPIVGKRVHYKYDKRFRRKYFWLDDDVTENEDPFVDKHGRRGFRMMSMILANPENIHNKDAIDFLYDIRNIASLNNIIKAYGTFREELWKIAKKKLKLSDLESKLSNLLETRFKFVELDDASPSFDLDDIGDDRRIEIINGYPH